MPLIIIAYSYIDCIFSIVLQKGIIETDDDMYVMEPADDNNKDHSHVAYKMKQKPMVFEDSNGIVQHCIDTTIYCICYCIALPCPTYKIENGWLKYIRQTVHHKCRVGYQLFGSFLRKCLRNGEWSGNTPVCVRKSTATC